MLENTRLGGYRFLSILIACVTASLSMGFGQTAPRPTLDELLLRLQSNLDDYKQAIPSFFCSETVATSLNYSRKHQVTVTDSIFKVIRSASGALMESHEIQAVTGPPVPAGSFGGPGSIRGVLTGGLETVSTSQNACMHYVLEPVSDSNERGPYIIRFTTRPDSLRRPECVLHDEASGQVLVDPKTLRVTRMEFTAPNRVIDAAEIGTWHLSINYAPVVLMGKTFWMPSVLHSTAVPNESDDAVSYAFSSRYTDFHKLEVTSQMLPVR
ncbi:hypothetical protein HDF16_005780 [Granulicella aggregans]|uniref:Outer membrane lipoprotein-sorting protein n=1 Tax=Granulicella aggregans TaxID=474949 RepID=A0A7W7ZJF1_9BACT|nr:hypothetical protein [Granulicella aggregans]MBB5061044.1 hypothetical protein [Granulicella aggregans]